MIVKLDTFAFTFHLLPGTHLDFIELEKILRISSGYLTGYTCELVGDNVMGP